MTSIYQRPKYEGSRGVPSKPTPHACPFHILLKKTPFQDHPGKEVPQLFGLGVMDNEELDAINIGWPPGFEIVVTND